MHTNKLCKVVETIFAQQSKQNSGAAGQGVNCNSRGGRRGSGASGSLGRGEQPMSGREGSFYGVCEDNMSGSECLG